MSEEVATHGHVIGVVIVTYNSAGVIDELLDCLETFDVSVDLMIVDNDSQDDTVERCRKHPAGARVVVNDGNVGFARAVRKGVALVDGEFVLLLNPDARLSSETCAELILYLKSHPGCGVVGPLVNERQTDRAIPAGWAPTLPRMITHMSGLSRFAGHFSFLRGHYLLRNQVASEVSLDWVTGACLLTRRTAWESVGGMTTRWFMYAEDLDYCLRIGQAGWTVVLLGGLHAEHAAGLSSADTDGRVGTDWIVNLAELYDVHYGRFELQRMIWRAVVGLGFLARSAVVRSPYDRGRFRAYGSAILNSSKAKGGP